MSVQHYAWQGEDDPCRFDLAAVTLLDRTGLEGHGTSITEEYALSWNLIVDENWVTRELHVSVHGDGWDRSLKLSRWSDTTWSADTDRNGDPDLAPPGLQRGVDLKGLDYCDLGLCPVTNIMPIRRLGLLECEVEEQRITVAWVDVPSLQVIKSVQRYRSFREGDELRVGYVSESRDFASELGVDADGMVIDYPGLARRLR